MRALLLAVLLLPAAPSVRAQDDEPTPPVQRYLAELQLGDRLETVKRLYPPAQEWPALDRRGGVTRYKIARAMAKAFPAGVETLFLGFKNGRLIEVETVFDAKKSREQTVERLAGDYALIYGEAKRSDERFWWSDGRTVLRVFPAEVPLPEQGIDAVAWRTAVQVFDQGLSGRAE